MAEMDVDEPRGLQTLVDADFSSLLVPLEGFGGHQDLATLPHAAILVLETALATALQLGLILPPEDPEIAAILFDSSRDIPLIIATLASTHAGREVLIKLFDLVHSYWNEIPGSPGYGIGRIMHRNLDPAFHADLKRWAPTRVHGNFIVLFDRPDGTVVVSIDEKPSKVYLVSSLAQEGDATLSLGQVLARRFDSDSKQLLPRTTDLRLASNIHHGSFIGAVAYMVLLPWQGKIITDARTACTTSLASNAQAKATWKAYIKAVETGTLFMTLVKSDEQESDWNDDIFSEESLQELRTKLSGRLRDLARPKLKKATSSWSFRRYSYTEERNPQHKMSLFEDQMTVNKPEFASDRYGETETLPEDESVRLKRQRGNCLIRDFNCSSLHPTLEELINILHFASIQQKQRPPSFIFVDSMNVVSGLQSLLGAEVEVRYAVPEQLTIPKEKKKSEYSYETIKIPTNAPDVLPFHWQAANAPNFQPARCNIDSCGCTHNTVDGKQLLRCSKCHNVCYCSAEHQKADWTARHKWRCQKKEFKFKF